VPVQAIGDELHIVSATAAEMTRIRSATVWVLIVLVVIMLAYCVQHSAGPMGIR